MQGTAKWVWCDKRLGWCNSTEGTSRQRVGRPDSAWAQMQMVGVQLFLSSSEMPAGQRASPPASRARALLDPSTVSMHEGDGCPKRGPQCYRLHSPAIPVVKYKRQVQSQSPRNSGPPPPRKRTAWRPSAHAYGYTQHLAAVPSGHAGACSAAAGANCGCRPPAG